MNHHDKGSDMTIGVANIPIKNGPPSSAHFVIDGFKAIINGRAQPADNPLPHSLMSNHTLVYIGIDIMHVMRDQFMGNSEYPSLRFLPDVLSDLKRQVAEGNDFCTIHFTHNGVIHNGMKVHYSGSHKGASTAHMAQ